MHHYLGNYQGQDQIGEGKEEALHEIVNTTKPNTMITDTHTHKNMALCFNGIKANYYSVRHVLKDNEGPFWTRAELNHYFANVESTPEYYAMYIVQAFTFKKNTLKVFAQKYIIQYSMIHNECVQSFFKINYESKDMCQKFTETLTLKKINFHWFPTY